MMMMMMGIDPDWGLSRYLPILVMGDGIVSESWLSWLCIADHAMARYVCMYCVCLLGRVAGCHISFLLLFFMCVCYGWVSGLLYSSMLYDECLMVRSIDR